MLTTAFWDNPNAIFMFVPLSLLMLIANAMILKHRLLPRRILAMLCPNEVLPPIKPFYWRIALVYTIAFILLMLSPFLRYIFGSMSMTIAVNLFVFISCNIALQQFSKVWLEQFGIVPERVKENLKALEERRHKIGFLLNPNYIFVCLILLMLAALSPQGSERTTRLKQLPFQIAILFDLSASMQASDIAPSRLEAAKDEIQQLFRLRPYDEFALVYFTDLAFTRVPLTQDYRTLRRRIQLTRSDQMPSQGSDLGTALLQGLHSLAPIKLKSLRSDYQTRRIVLFSDGEDHGSRLEEALQKLKEENIPVDVIAFGSDGGAELFDERGQPLKYQGQNVITHPNIGLLRRISEQSGGLYQRYSIPEASANRLSNFYNKARLEMQDRDKMPSLYRYQLYWIFLIPAYLLLLLGFILAPITAFLHCKRSARNAKVQS